MKFYSELCGAWCSQAAKSDEVLNLELKALVSAIHNPEY